jgi:hypothetical protein
MEWTVIVDAFHYEWNDQPSPNVEPLRSQLGELADTLLDMALNNHHYCASA